MTQAIGAVTVVVGDYDEAITYYISRLGFDLLEDVDLGKGKRWVLVRPPGGAGTCLLLAKAANADQRMCISDQTGGRVFLFLYTDDFWADYEAFSARGVHFSEVPRRESYGVVVVFEDLYGNRWDLVEARNKG